MGQQDRVRLNYGTGSLGEFSRLRCRQDKEPAITAADGRLQNVESFYGLNEMNPNNPAKLLAGPAVKKS